MSSSQASGRIRAAALAGIALAAVLLAGCTSDFLVDGGTGAAPTPAETTATPQPTATEEAPQVDPDEEFDCVNLLIDRPGNYVVGDCRTVTLQGSGIRLTFTSITELVIRGDGVDVVGEALGSVDINGQRSEISAFQIDDVTIRGDDNVVTVETNIGSVTVQGNRNVVSAGDGIDTPAIDNGIDNDFG